MALVVQYRSAGQDEGPREVRTMNDEPLPTDETQTDSAGHLAAVAERWHQFRNSGALGPTLKLASGALAGAAALLLSSSGRKSLVGPAGQAVEKVLRTSPVKHAVSGYTRFQHYGPGNAQTKVVNIAPFVRGGA